MDTTAIVKQIRDFREENSDLEDIQAATKKELYMTIASQVPRIFKTLFDGLDSDNESIRIKAAQGLLNKILPDLKASEIKSDITQSLQGLIVLAAHGTNKQDISG